MKVGQKTKFIIPPNLAFGSAGDPPRIPKNAYVVYEVKLLSIDKSLNNQRVNSVDNSLEFKEQPRQKVFLKSGAIACQTIAHLNLVTLLARNNDVLEFNRYIENGYCLQNTLSTSIDIKILENNIYNSDDSDNYFLKISILDQYLELYTSKVMLTSD